MLIGVFFVISHAGLLSGGAADLPHLPCATPYSCMPESDENTCSLAEFSAHLVRLKAYIFRAATVEVVLFEFLEVFPMELFCNKDPIVVVIGADSSRCARLACPFAQEGYEVFIP